MYIPYGKQTIEQDDIDAVVEVLQSDYLTTGPKPLEFEQAVAEYVGAKYAVAVANGTAALHLACMAAGIKEGDEVITTPITFAASANCVLYCGATPVFADICKDTYNIDVESIKAKITPRTKAIIPVHFTGQPCDMEPILALAKEHKLMVIEDGAHSLGASYQGKRIGSIGDMTTFSFHPVKHITTCEGGMITTNNKALYEKLLLLRSHGITREPSKLMKQEGPWYYEQQDLGYNYRISDVQCALGISQLKKLHTFVAKRRAIAKRYDKAFASVDNIVTPKQLPAGKSSYHLYVIQVKNHDRRKVFEALREKGIGVNVHYIPVYQHPYYQQNGYESVICKEAQQLYEHMISLPIYPLLTEEEQEYVIQTVKELVQ